MVDFVRPLGGRLVRGRRIAAGTALIALVGAALLAVPAQAAAPDPTVQEIRLRQLEAQVRDLLRQQQPGAPRTVVPQTTPPTAPTGPMGAPSGTAVTDMLTRMDSLEAQVARLTAQNEEMANRLRQLEASPASQQAAAATVAAQAATAAAANPPPPSSSVAAPAGQTTNGNLAAMTGGASAPRPAPTPKPVKASAQRVAAVQAIVKPQTSDAGDDEYSYGYRLYDAKFYPEAAQQLKLFIDKYPRHARASQGRNLLGRALLDDGKPREAAPWFLENYKSDPRGNRAADSLLNLAEAMKQLNDSGRACIALGEFANAYATEAKGRLRSQYEQTRSGLTCSN